jgi:hypothetical protein
MTTICEVIQVDGRLYTSLDGGGLLAGLSRGALLRAGQRGDLVILNRKGGRPSYLVDLESLRAYVAGQRVNQMASKTAVHPPEGR